MPPEDPADKMFDAMFEFKMMGKQMAKESKKAESQSKALVEKVKNALQKEIMNKPKMQQVMLYVRKIWLKDIVFYQVKLILLLKDLKPLIKTKNLLDKCKVLPSNYLVLEV